MCIRDRYMILQYESPPIVLSGPMFKRIFQLTEKEALHSISLPHLKNNFPKVMGRAKHISTFTQMQSHADIWKSGIGDDRSGGIVLHVKGNVTGQFNQDLYTEILKSGRRVIMLNDDFTPMDFVVYLLKTFFQKNNARMYKIFAWELIPQKGQLYYKSSKNKRLHKNWLVAKLNLPVSQTKDRADGDLSDLLESGDSKNKLNQELERKLKHLKRLYEEGLIEEEEYKAQQNKLFEKLF